MRSFLVRSRAVAFGLCLLVICPPLIAAQRQIFPGAGTDVPTPQPILTDNELLWQVAPDECFNGIGAPYPVMNADGTCSAGIPKANQSYIWGLTEQSGKLWFGTMANTACLLDGLAAGNPTVNNLFVCEFGMSQIALAHPGMPANLGDWRPPRIYSWDLATGTLLEHDLNTPVLLNTLGLRGAGSISNIAFLAGPGLDGKSVNFFAFRADTGQFLGACTRTDYDYIRGWAQVDGVLYVGAGSPTTGVVLRWNGSAQSFGSGNYCSQFVEVGHLTADAANVTLYVGGDGQDRLAVTTVPIRNGNGSGAGVGVWISPPIPSGGLTPDNADSWRQVWSPMQYDPDKIVSRYGYSGGAVQYYDGWLYWGTIHLQNSAAIGIHEKCTQSYCFGAPSNGQQLQALKNGVYRTTSVWRARNLENPRTREIQLLYGESQLPACCSAPKTFAMQPTGWTPLYGPSGFGNPANEYTWTMEVFDGHLFVGTYDASVLQGGSAENGADLWRFDSPDSAAVNENYVGLGDPLNYGIRIMHALSDGSGLVLGMANPFNLAPGGGWELRLLKESPPQQAKPLKSGR